MFIPHLQVGLAMLRRENILSLFREYYATADLAVENIPRREIAFQTWDSRMVRHQSHDSIESLRESAQKRAPKALYASLSYYLDPSHKSPKEVDRKSVNCQDCGHSYKSDTPKSPCPKCGIENEKANTNTKDRRAMDLAFDIDYGDIPGASERTPTKNLGAAARSTLNLAKILVSDLGFDYSDLDITFSGKKGFHIRLSNSHPLFSDSNQTDESVRKALVNYVGGYDFDKMDFLLIKAHAQAANTWHLKAYESGWGYRFNQSIEYLLKAASAKSEEFTKVLQLYSPWHTDKKKYGTKKSLPSQKVIEGFRKACNENRDSILKGGNIRDMKDSEAKRLLSFALARTRLRHASFVDRVVTADKARVLRVPGSIHGGSGMVCCKVPTLKHLTDMSWVLDLQKELLGGEEVEVSISRVANTYYGVYEPGEHKVPKHIAYALLCSQ
jgi:DNA primase small subunit